MELSEVMTIRRLGAILETGYHTDNRTLQKVVPGCTTEPHPQGSFFLFIFRQGLTVLPSQTLSSFYSSGCPMWDPPASDSKVARKIGFLHSAWLEDGL